VADSSDYSKFKKYSAINKIYNDNSFGGDQSHASYTATMAIRRF
jgi:hypothetical protein